MSFWTPEIPTDNYLEKGRFILAWRLAVVTSVLFVLLTINFSNSLFHFITYLVCLGLAIGSLILLHYAKSARGVYLMAATVGTVIVSYNLIYLNDIYQVSNIIWKVFIITYTFFGLGKKWGVVVLFANLLALVYYSLITVNYNISSIPNLDLFGRISLAIELTIVTSLTTYVIYQFVQINSKSHGELISANKKLQERNATIENQNEEKTTLVKEIHHRVKNNLQVIISLLRLQKNELKSEEAKTQFSQAINRVLVMSLIHKRLYHGDELSKVKIASYLQELSEDIKSLSDTGFRTKISVHSEIEKMGLKTIVPMGLLINELVSNSIKHAFKDKTSGEVKIEISQLNGDDFNLTYFDNGQWREPKKTATFGIELIQILAEQMDGEVKRESNDKGTLYTFSLKNIDT